MAQSEILMLMEQAARKAGESLLRDFAHLADLEIDLKGPGDFVSQADQRSEKIIVDMLLAAKPDWGILGEEGANVIGKEARYRFITDPLDGTTNFLLGLPFWAVTIALEEDGQIITGVTFDALRDEMFTVEKGKGAFVNGKVLKLSARQTLQGATILMDTALNDFDNIDRYIHHFASIQKNQGTVMRSLGCAALDFAYVAAGRADGCVLQGKLKPWDIATGILLVREAGGVVINFSRQPAHHDLGDLLAAPPALHSELADLIGLH